MSLLWAGLAALVILAGVRYLARLRAGRSRDRRVDDDALRQILHSGSLSTLDDDDEPLDLDAAARAEEEFWDESWDEPEEFPR